MEYRYLTLARLVLASFALGLLLSACGGGGGSSDGNPPTDTTPDPFAFTAQSGMMPSTVVTSNEVTITGINSGAPISVTGGEYSIDGAAFITAASTVNNNQRVRVRFTAANQFSTAASASLSVGGISGTFSATTVAADTTPAAFTFAYGVNVVRNDWISSDTVTITDINTTTPVSISNGEYAIAGGTFTSAAGTIANGQTIVVRVRASAEYSRIARATLTVGGVTANFEVTSELPVYLPDAVDYDGIDTVYLLNAANHFVFRWSVSEARYLDAYTLTAGTPTQMVYLPARQRLYFGYASGAVTQMVVTVNDPPETAFATAPGPVNGLGNAGNFLTLQTSGYGGGYIYDGAGNSVGQGGYYYGYSHETAWDPQNQRIYYTRDGISPNDLHYDVINQTTGAVSSSGETPHHGDYTILPPIRVSANGQYVLLGSGDIYSQANNLGWAGSVAGQVADARWFANGTLVTLSSASNQTSLRRLSSTNLSVIEQKTYSGTAVRIAGTDSAMAVVLTSNGDTQIVKYVPNDDSDGDGVANTADAFPLDVAASVDTDRDGYPDAWNTGHTQADSTTGLVLDSFPQDAACWLAAHGSGGVCDYGATIPNYVPDKVVNNGDIIYLLSSANHRVYRWSISGNAYLNPYVVRANQGFVTTGPTTLAYSSGHNRLYLGYGSGAIHYIDLAAASPVEVQFANAPASIVGLGTPGNYLAVQAAGGYDSGYIYDRNGAVTGHGGYYYGYSSETEWEPTGARLYYTRDGLSPNDLHYDVINQGTGLVTSTGETPYHGSYNIQSPIRASVGGQYVLLGSGDIYRSSDLTWVGGLGGSVADARWLANGSLVTLTNQSQTQTVLRRLSATNLTTVEQITYSGQALRVVGSDTAMVVITLNNGTVQFNSYVPNDDTDGDGVPNTTDAFPLDRAASVDTDQDGYPDGWNAGRSQSDSTTGLVLDSFPQDSACWLAAHGSGGVCNYGATLPNYVPDKVVNNGDIIYLLSSANYRVYRWSMTTGAYLNPYVVGINQGFTTLAPSTMEYQPAHHRLYLGYSNGSIRYIDVNGANAEVPFANAAYAVSSLGSAGNFLAAQTGGYGGGYVYDATGAVTAQGGYYYGYSAETFWDPVNSRLYYKRDGISPNDLHYDVINQTTGAITGTGETPYHGDHNIGGVIRSSVDGSQIFLGIGDFYDANGLIYLASLNKQVTDAFWTSDFFVDVDTTDRVEIRDARTRAVLQFYQYPGQPVRMLVGATETYLVHVLNGTTAFARLPFYDADGDTMPRWWEQIYGLSDTSAADATDDLDSDGLNNAAEYAGHANPTVADTDGDGLNDAAEVNTYHTHPGQTDTDGDGLSDAAEVNTHLSNPLVVDSDGDGYSDQIEVLYDGNPNDNSVLPVPLMNYTQTFEGSPNLSAWSTPPASTAPWAVSTSAAHGGSASFKSGTVDAISQFSSTRWRGFFSQGTLSFWSRMDTTSCCNRIILLIDGNPVWSYYGGVSDWTQNSVEVPVGVHDIEWQFVRDYYSSSSSDAAFIDDVAFTGQ